LIVSGAVSIVAIVGAFVALGAIALLVILLRDR
jgi:hypothetical protein